MSEIKNNPVSEDSCFARKDTVICRTIADAVVLVPVHKSAVALEALFTLNDTAARIWQLLDGKKNCRQIAVIVASEWDCTLHAVMADVIGLMEELRRLGFIEEGQC
jgi:hypothetical protein